jgi:hypothetical protein
MSGLEMPCIEFMFEAQTKKTGFILSPFVCILRIGEYAWNQN